MRRSDFFTLGVLFVMLSAVAGSIVAAEWMPGLGTIFWAVILSLLAGTALAYSSFPGWTAHLTSLVYGLFSTTVIAISQDDMAQAADPRDRVLLLIDKIAIWMQEAFNNGTSRETVIFILILTGLFWLLGYSAAWYSFRHRRVWHVILPAGVTLFSNVYYYAGERSMVPFLLIYLICAVTLLALSHLAEREVGWLAERVRFSTSLRGWFVVAAIGIATVAGLFGWRVSEASASTAGRDLLNQLNQPYNELLARWNRLFANLNNNIDRQVDSYQREVILGGPRTLTPEPVMDVLAPPARYYWRAASYDNYDGFTWRNTIDTATNAQPWDTELPLAGYASRVPVQADFALFRGSDSVYAPSIPLRSSVGSQATFEIVGPGSVDLVQLKLPVPLLSGNRYAAVGSMSTANVPELRSAPRDYPDWVRDRYLQVAPAVPDRVGNLARNIAGAALTPFDKAALIELWLRDNIAYDERLEAPPAGVEASDYVLFDVKRAYCNYYATAMVTMLRLLGVPARVAVGYAQGELSLDPSVTDRALYHVKASDSHMWVEVFFPDYGWVEFEPTAGQPPIERFDPDTESGLAADHPTPPTPTPPPAEQSAATPTPEPSATPDGGAPAQPPAEPPPPPTTTSSMAEQLKDSWLPYLLIIPILLLVAWGAFTVVERAGFGRLPAVERAYALLTRYASWLGIGKSRQHTPYEQAEALAQRAPNARAPMWRITDLYVHKRFAPPREGETGLDAEAERAWKQARRWLRRALFGRNRAD
jgi:transglutaminase-like putative cysteine protease